MTREDVINILNEVGVDYRGSETEEALNMACKCVKFIGSMCKVLESRREEREIDVARAYIEGFKLGVFGSDSK